MTQAVKVNYEDGSEPLTKLLVVRWDLWEKESQGKRLMPMKRFKEDGSTPDFGMMLDVDEPGRTYMAYEDTILRVYTRLRDFASLNTDDLDVNEQEIFHSVEDLVEAGWRVD